ncbi:transporter substrate-binding domain-containing protein [Pseudoalteromonas sp. CNAT2-18]|nr:MULTISPECIES: transporter substrate-binding domain-containing protein [unclassified Pseudoalteromonas]MCF2863847.1 transporter substrate-binding domain-containing protein [Pseudoalteromonas sp. CNAT2-18]MCG7559768.1 transporter substrate-binding domain-containing protein [Pseudoalteromonas sp. CNAT2-18.1]
MSNGIEYGRHLKAMQYLKYHIWVWLIAMSLSFSLVAQPQLQLYTEHWPPYNYLNEQGQVVGRATQAVRGALEAANIDADIHLTTWARAYNLAKTRANHGIFAIYKTAQRHQLFHWFCPISAPTPMFIYKRSDDQRIKVHSLADVKQYTLAVSRDGWTHQHLRQQGFSDERHLDVAASIEVSMTKFLAGRLDLILNTEAAMTLALRQRELSANTVIKVWELQQSQRTPLCLAVNKHSDPQLVQALKQVFDEKNKR